MQYYNSMRQLADDMSSYSANGVPLLFAVDFELQEGFVVADPCSQQEILFRTPLMTNMPAPTAPPRPPRVEPVPVAFSQYKKGFDVVMEGLLHGDSYLTNYTMRTYINMNLTLKEVVLSSLSPFCLFVPERFVSFSPERFVEISGDEIKTLPMKGTIDATLQEAEQRLVDDEKELAEHVTVVDLLRNDIGMVAHNVEVSRFRFISRVKTLQGCLLQTSTEVTGQLPADWRWHLGDILMSLLPAGSVSGAPKKSTLRIISEAEKSPRGFYCGVFGVFDGRRFDSAVLIRYIEKARDGGFFFRSGGGVTVHSNVQTEYDEAINKIYLTLK